MVELRGRLVVPRAPGLTAVYGEGRTLIGSDQHDVGVVRIDPDAVIVIASWRALDRGESLTTVDRPVRGCVRRKHHVRIARIHFDLGEVRRAAKYALLRIRASPRLARIVGAVNAAKLRSLHRRIHPPRIARSNCEPDPSQSLRGCWQTGHQLAPGRPAIDRFEEAAQRSVPARVLPRTLTPSPQCCVNNLRVGRIEADLTRAG